MSGGDYARPASLDEACRIRAERPEWTVLAGGTDLMVGVHHRPPPPGVLDLFGLAELRGVALVDGAIRIGAATTYADLLRSELVRAELPSLWECAREVGAVQIQERGTIGGNVGTSSPVGDTLPVLLALDAELELASTGGVRRVPYDGFVTGYRRTDLRPDELIAAVVVPRPPAGTVHFWRKVGTRRAQAISKVMVAGAGRVGADGAVEHARLAMGAVADRPVRLPACEAMLTGMPASDELAKWIQASVRQAIEPISDVRSTADYRLAVAERLAARFVRRLAAAGEGA